MTEKVQHVMRQEEISSLKVVSPPPGLDKAPQRCMTQYKKSIFLCCGSKSHYLFFLAQMKS